MRTRIREITQVDAGEISDGLADSFLSEAWRHCAFWKTDWPFYRQTWTHTFVGDGANDTITMKDLVAGATDEATVARPATPNAIEQVFDVTRQRQLRHLDPADFNKLRYGSSGVTSSGDPTHWTVVAGQYRNDTIENVGWDVGFDIRIWPVPTTTVELRLEGTREPINFAEPSYGYVAGDVPGGYHNAEPELAVPDMPPAFHQAILNYAIGLAFTFLDEGDRSLFYIQLCDNILVQQEDNWFRLPPSDGPLRINGGNRFDQHLPSRMRFDWE